MGRPLASTPAIRTCSFTAIRGSRRLPTVVPPSRQLARIMSRPKVAVRITGVTVVFSPPAGRFWLAWRSWHCWQRLLVAVRGRLWRFGFLSLVPIGRANRTTTTQQNNDALRSWLDLVISNACPFLYARGTPTTKNGWLRLSGKHTFACDDAVKTLLHGRQVWRAVQYDIGEAFTGQQKLLCGW